MSALGAKLFPSLHGYEHKWLRPDVIAAMSLWAVLVPEALAYAAIAGVSPIVGLYAVPGALILYAALGSSRELVTGPGAAAAALSAATVGEAAAGGSEEFVQLTVALALCVGAAALIAGFLRLGFVASLIDVTAARMLRDLNEQLDRGGVRLLVARDVGQVRDVLRRAVPDAKFDKTYPSVDRRGEGGGTCREVAGHRRARPLGELMRRQIGSISEGRQVLSKYGWSGL
jgi:MFS superfamily sulfate permease-like transporter